MGRQHFRQWMAIIVVLKAILFCLPCFLVGVCCIRFNLNFSSFFGPGFAFHMYEMEACMKRVKSSKNRMGVIIAVVGLTAVLSFQLASAGTQLEELHKKSSEFNEMITESQNNSEELRKTLSEQAGIKLDQSKPGTVTREKVEAPKEAEQVVAESTNDFWKQDKKQRKNKLELNREQTKRLSEEIKESTF